MQKEKINFRLGRTPMVKPNIIVLTEADGRKAVIFPKYRPAADIAHAEVAKEGEVLELEGIWGTDKKTGKPQFYVDKAFNANIEEESILTEEQRQILEESYNDPEYQAWAASPDGIVNGFAAKPTINISQIPKHQDIIKSMDDNFYPMPLMPNDPYSINPEVDFNESDKIKTFTVKDRLFYSDGIFFWEKDNNVFRQKIIMTPILIKEYEKAISDPMDLLAIY